MRPKAIATGLLAFGDTKVDCYVLEDKRRVLSARGIQRAFSGAGDGRLKRRLARLPSRFADLASRPDFEFEMPGGESGGGIAHGHEATWFVDVCDAYVDAFMAGELHPSQHAIADQCATKSELWQRLDAHYRKQPLQLSFN